MAAELLDIEAKLDTSQVQGQLSQLSKTSGLQNLDRAIRTLEQSMKRLSSVLDRQAQQAATSVGGGNPERLLGGRHIRSIGGYFIGRTLSEMGAATGNKTLKSIGGLAGSVAKGAAAGGLIGNAPGVVVGAAVGALDFAFKELADTTKNLTEQIEKSRKAFYSTYSDSVDLQMSYSQKEFIRTAKEMSSLGLSTALPAAKSDYETARQNEAEVQQMLAAFESSAQWKNTLKYSVDKGIVNPEFKKQAEELQKVYNELTALAKSAAEETNNAEQRLRALEARQKELAREEEHNARAAAQAEREEKRLAQHREQLVGKAAEQFNDMTFSNTLETVRAIAAELTPEQREKRQAEAQKAAEKSYKAYEEALEKMMSAAKPEDYEDIVENRRKAALQDKQFADAWEINKLPKQLSLSPLSLLGSTNNLQQMGAYAYRGQEYNYANYFTQIVSKLSRIETNTAYAPTTTQGNTIG